MAGPPVFVTPIPTQLSMVSSTTAAVTSPSSVVSGDIVVVVLYVESTATVTPPSGFAYVTSSPQTTTTGSGLHASHVFWKRSAGGEPGSYTFTFSVATYRRGGAFRITGASGDANPWDATNGAVRSSAASTTPAVSITTTGTDRLAIWTGTCWDSTSWTPPTGFTTREPTSGTSELSYSSKDILTASSTGSLTGTTTASNWGTGWVGALKPAESTITATGINHPPVFGAAVVSPGPVTVTGIGLNHPPVFGTIQVNQTINRTGINHPPVFGLANVTGGIVTTSIVHPTVFGTAVVSAAPVTVTATGINHPPVFGAAVIIASVIGATGIPGGTAFGATIVYPDAVTVIAVGIPSGLTMGFAQVNQVATALTSEILVRPAPRVRYELVIAARIPSSSGAPTYIEIDPISWTDIRYSQKISAPDTLDVSVLTSTLTDSIKQRLKKPSEMATELWLRRNGKIVFAGPLMGGQVQGESLSLSANGLLAYLDWMIIPQDLVYKATDQFDIVKGVVDSWQNGAFRHLGIDTTTMGQSGVTMDMTYLKIEVNNVYAKVTALAKAAQGFDLEVDPTTRKLQLHYPTRGVDRSTGPEAIVFDDRNVTDTNITFALGPADLATDAFGVGTGTGQDQASTFYSTAVNDELRSRFGAVGIARAFRDVSSQAVNDSFTQALIDARRETLWIPGPNVRVTPDADLLTYEVGDTVSYRLHNELDIEGAFRLLGRQINVSQDGVETITAAFV